MQNSKVLRITDDSGFLGIANADKYKSFVSEDWELSQLFQHFVQEINNDHLVLWATEAGNTWTINFVNKATELKAFRDFHKSIEVTNGEIFLTNYEDLTMAAQYADNLIPNKHNSDLSINLNNGRYTLQVRQLFDPSDCDYEPEGKVNFEIVVQAEESKKNQLIEKVFWSEQ